MQILISLRACDNAFDEIAKFQRVASERADLAAFRNVATMTEARLTCSHVQRTKFLRVARIQAIRLQFV